MEEYLVSLLSPLLPAGHWVAWCDAGEAVSAPYMILQQVSGLHDVDVDGPEDDASARIQLDIYAETPDEARDLGLGALDILNGHKGGPIQSCFNLSNRALSAAGDGAIIQRRSLDFAVSYAV